MDDSIEEKPSTDESELVCWHWDHCLKRTLKGINLLSALYHTQEVSLPIAFELIQKSAWETDKKTGKQKRVCPLSKHTYFRQMVDTALANGLPFRYLLADTWFASAEKMVYLKQEKHKDFIFPLKDNRFKREDLALLKVALSQEDKLQGRYVSVCSLLLEENTALEIWLERVDFPLLLTKFPSSALQADLYKQRRQPGSSLSGDERSELECLADADNLPETVESRSLS